jgi:hypothetical protein
MKQNITQSAQDPTMQTTTQQTMDSGSGSGSGIVGQNIESGQQQLKTDQTGTGKDSTQQIPTILQGVQSDLKTVDRLTAWLEPENFALLSQIPWEKYSNVEQLKIPNVKLNNGNEMPVLSLTHSRVGFN